MIVKKVVWRFFFKSHFFTMRKYRLFCLVQNCTNAPVLPISFYRIDETTCRWAHLIDLLKSFPTVTNFLMIHQNTTKLWAVKVILLVQVVVTFCIMHECICFAYIFLTNWWKYLQMGSFDRSFRELSNCHQFFVDSSKYNQIMSGQSDPTGTGCCTGWSTGTE